jgi:hypothetical protein
MDEQWRKFSENICLTEKQKKDAQTKYEGVCKKLHSSYYDTTYDGSTKLLFGSYQTKTNVRPLTDVDVIFKIPKETYDKFKNYESGGQSALLQEVREFLKEKYTTTDTIKAWGKVVLVEFADNTHNVEVLPAFEKDDKTFIIPNTENGGSWNNFDPRKQIDEFNASNKLTNGTTVELARIIKIWVNNTSTCNYKSFYLLTDVMKFLGCNFKTGVDYSKYSTLVKNFFQYLKSICNDNIKSHVQTALDRAIKACDYEKENKLKEAADEWRKIFGTEFPSIKSNSTEEKDVRIFTNPSAPYSNTLLSGVEAVYLTSNDIEFLQNDYPSLHYDMKKNLIFGNLAFKIQYNELETISDNFQIEIDLNRVNYGVPAVRETGGRIINIAKQKNVSPNNLHLNSVSGEMCIIIPPKAKEKYPNGFDLETLLKHLEEHFYWICYFEKYNREPWKAYGHGEKGYLELYIEDKKYSKDFKKYFKCNSRPEVRRKVKVLKRKYKI